MLNGFKLWLICCDHEDMYKVHPERIYGGIVLVEEVYAIWHFSIILISLRVKVAQILDF